MTSKAAKRAHQLATRGPKISRAEQRRREAEALAQQKKDFEREKASARAKAAREKKAAKEQTEKDARKKMGLPEPSRFVRASQPTISRFVRSGNKQTWVEVDHAAEESDGIAVCDEEADRGTLLEPPAKKVKTRDESEDEYGGFPSFSHSEIETLLEDIDSSTLLESVQNDRPQSRTSTPERQPESKSKTPSIIEQKNSYEIPWELPEDIDDMAATQLRSEAADGAVRPAQQQKHLEVSARAEIASSRLDLIAKPAPYVLTKKPPQAKPVANIRPALQERSINMPPPPLPAQKKETRSISFAPSPLQPRNLPRKLPRSPPSTPSKPALPPSATQAFLEDHLDDFFPSPSQEIRELRDDIDELPTNTQIAKELAPSLHTAMEPAEEDNDTFTDLICTQDLILSPQDMLEISIPCPPPSKPTAAFEQHRSTPTPLPSKTPPRRPSCRFFKEKDEDLLHAAIQESKALAAQEQVIKRETARMSESRIVVGKREQKVQDQEPSRRTKRALKRTLSNATDYGDDEFHDCEEELLALC